jgi:1,4-alpha-glucan branching enzyme
VPNRFGGRENLDAVSFLQQLNTMTHGEHPGTITAAEESTSWPGVSRPVYVGGLGFTYKWNLGWMHDMLDYTHLDPIHRRWHHTKITFTGLYMHSENYILPFSHDEVVHGKGPMLDKMSGDAWQKYATLRVLYAYMYAHPGKKLTFMGNEFAQSREWNHDRSLDWHLLNDAAHAGVARLVADLNARYRSEPALFESDNDPQGFRWIDCNDNENSVVSLVRYARDRSDFLVTVFNFTPIPRAQYRIGVPAPGAYAEVLNTDADCYGGSNVGNDGRVESEPIAAHGFEQSVRLRVPPLGALYLKRD